MEALTIHAPYVVHDLPTGAPRWVQWVSGYDMTIVSGVVTHEHNQPACTEEDLPGRLVRNPRTQHVRDVEGVRALDLASVLAGRGPAQRPLIGRGDRGSGDALDRDVLNFRDQLCADMKELMLAARRAPADRAVSKL